MSLDENVIGWEIHWMKLLLDESVLVESVKIGWKCQNWMKVFWMKVSLDEIVFGWKCHWMKSCLDESVIGWNRFWMKVYSTNSSCECVQFQWNTSSHNLWKLWHGQMRFVKEYSSATVERTIFFYFLTFKLNQNSINHSLPWKSLARFCRKHCHAFFLWTIILVSVRGIKKTKYSQWSSELPVPKFHWLWLDCLANLWRDFISPTVGETSIEKHLENVCNIVTKRIHLSYKASAHCMHWKSKMEVFFLASSQ